MINYCLMDFGIFVLFFCIIVVIPHLILRFVTFTQKSEFLCVRTFFKKRCYTLVRFTIVNVTTAVAQLSISVHISEQQWLLRRTLRSNVFDTLIGTPYVKRTSMTIIYTVHINFVQSILIHAKSC